MNLFYSTLTPCFFGIHIIIMAPFRFPDQNFVYIYDLFVCAACSHQSSPPSLYPKNIWYKMQINQEC